MSKNTTFIHCADLHLDSPFQGLAIKEPALAERFKDSTNEAFVQIIDLCLAESVDFLTIGGDTFDGVDRSLRAQILLREQFERLQKRGIPVIIVAGNHDPLSEWVMEIGFPPNVHLLSGDKVEAVSVEKSINVIATIYGISYQVRDTRENLSLKFQGEGGDGLSIGMLHANVGSRAGHEPYAPCTINDLRSIGMDMWLLGHIHTPEVVCRDPFMLYPGNIQGRHINEDGPRGCYLITVDVNRKISHEFRPVQNIVWGHEELNLEKTSTLLELVDLLSDRCEEQLSNITNSERGIVSRWTLTGASPLYHELTIPDKIDEVKEILVERFFHHSPFLFPESIRLSVKPVVERADFMNQESFISDFLRLAERGSDDAHMKTELLKILNQPLSNRVIRKYLTEKNETELLKILDAAVDLGLDLLSGG
ncbi:MAG: exonuclease SbcCD subunit D [Candidatus Scalindua sp.]|nr:DNA repair exonuclease [Planctomycetota bacterium]GJQ60523.1 MAG: exonuclease SbcCD subunit D [Candidatus Scalindua sp.]